MHVQARIPLRSVRNNTDGRPASFTYYAMLRLIALTRKALLKGDGSAGCRVSPLKMHALTKPVQQSQVNQRSWIVEQGTLQPISDGFSISLFRSAKGVYFI